MTVFLTASAALNPERLFKCMATVFQTLSVPSFVNWHLNPSPCTVDYNST